MAAFGVFWMLGMLYRANRRVHPRFMVATGLTFVDPVVARLVPLLPGAGNQILTFTLVELILVWLIWQERGAQQGRWAFPLVLAVYLIVELPIIFGLTERQAWAGFTSWFKALPLT